MARHCNAAVKVRGLVAAAEDEVSALTVTVLNAYTQKYPRQQIAQCGKRFQRKAAGFINDLEKPLRNSTQWP